MIITNEGWSPICEKRFMYEMTMSFTLNPITPGVVDLGLPHKLQDQHRMMFPPGQHIGRVAGQQLGAWARGDAVETPDKALWDRARREANKGLQPLLTFGEALSEADRLKLGPIATELKRTARLTDQNVGGPKADTSGLTASEIDWNTPSA